MFCIKCGKKNQEGDQYCVNCGHKTDAEVPLEGKQEVFGNKGNLKPASFWQRLLRVLYIISYLPLVVVVLVTWFTNNSDYVCSGYGYAQSCHSKATYEEAFFYSLLAAIIYMIIVRLIKVALQYIIYGKQPVWESEIKKWF